MLKQIQPLYNAKLSLKLFDALMFPIIAYGGVVWGPLYANKVTVDNFMTLCNDSPIEKLNTKLCRYILGVHRKSSNDAIRGELGRYPLLISILNNAFRYHQKIKKPSLNSLVKPSYLDDNLYNFHSSWHNSMDNLIKVFNQSRNFLNDIQNVYRNNWSENMKSCSGKLRTYGQFKTSFTQENYIIQLPFHSRQNLTKLRINAHNVAIETGR